MTNIDKAIEVIRMEFEDDSKVYDEYSISSALADAGLLTPAPQIIRTVEELQALDPETVVWPARHYGPYTVGTLVPDPFNPYWTPPLPAVVVATAEQVRAARKALEEA
ncbi:hypothetical protein ACYB2S_13840 [Corynebacterium variabile]|uniref:hypothetical protein n=1 Tax=Corynebacterium variabile TaxID=1727 RepID=UPI003C9F0BD0